MRWGRGELAPVPRAARVAMVGGGYARLAASLELSTHGIDAAVFEQRTSGVIMRGSVKSKLDHEFIPDKARGMPVQMGGTDV